MEVIEMVKKYYPKFWSRERVEALVAAGRLTRVDADKAMGGADSADGT